MRRRARPCAREVAAAQDLDRRAARGAPGRPGGGGDDDRDDREQRERAAAPASAGPGPSSLSAASRSAAGRATIERAERDPERRRGHGDDRAPRPPAGPRSGPGRSRARAARRSRSAAAGPRRGRRRRASSPRRPARRARTRPAARSRSPRPARAGSRTPVRVMNCSLPSPNATARAWVSVTSAFDGSLSHSSAMFGAHAASEPERVAELLLGDVHARGAGQRVGDVVGRDRDARRSAAPRAGRVGSPTSSVSPTCRSHSRASPRSTTTSPISPSRRSRPVDDQVAAAPAEQRGDRALARPLRARPRAAG